MNEVDGSTLAITSSGATVFQANDRTSKTLNWNPKTQIGRKVLKNEFKDVTQVLNACNQKIVEPEVVDYFEPLTSQMVSVSKISHSQSAGKVYGFRVVVLIGDGKGLIGCGVGKSIVKASAIKIATNKAKKELITLKKFINDDLIQPITTSKSKKGATLVTVKPIKGSSVTASKLGRLYCKMAGLTGIVITTGTKKRQKKGKVGSPLNYYTALHQAIKSQVI